MNKDVLKGNRRALADVYGDSLKIKLLKVTTPRLGFAPVLCFLVFSIIGIVSTNASICDVDVTSIPVWTDTGRTINSGDILQFMASGSWNWNVDEPSSGLCGPDGTPFSWTSDNFYGPANHGALIAYVGPDPYQSHWGDSSFFPQYTGYWLIGSSATIAFNTSGELWLGMNDDAYSTGGVQDNSGTLSVRVSAVPEPSTYLAGALMLLPFGLQGVRCLRNRR
jgi:hypothetical protein